MKNMRIMLIVILVSMTTIAFQFFSSKVPKAHAFSEQTIQRGATGSDVIELQARLQYNGYYNGPIDGVYGWSTYWAVRNYQKRFGLEEVDGLVGQKTKDMLLQSTTFYKDFVYDQINKGRKFTHYGGVPLSIQSAPNEKQIQQARQAAEQRRLQQEKKYQAQVNNQTQQRQQQAKEREQEQAQQQAQEREQQEQAQQQARDREQEQAQQQAQEREQQEQAQQQAREREQAQDQQQAQEREQAQAQQQARERERAQANRETERQQQARRNQNTNQTNNNKQQKDSTAVNLPNGFSQNDIQLMANAVYGESRGEPYIGQVAVAAVILNRVNSPTFPNTVSGVIFEPGAFTAVADGQIWLTPNETAKKAVLDALNGFDPTGNAIYYFNPNTATSSWIWGRPQIKRIGKHIFCK
ncbi:spore cortex-lytic enzyme [Metabacillus niabensis]|uniref:spore cortex-lytic enzyme n=1 Tax=Metabacillus niabensis TaxID=324854 RepID=UPI0039A318E3